MTHEPRCSGHQSSWSETYRRTQIPYVSSIIDDAPDQNTPSHSSQPDRLAPALDDPRIIPVQLYRRIGLYQISQRGLILALASFRTCSSRLNGLGGKGETGEVEPADVSRSEGEGYEVGFVG